MNNKKLKIGFFVDTFFPMVDGVIMVVDNYARRLSQFADVTVFAPTGRDKKYVDNFPYKVVRSSRLKLVGMDYDLPLPTLDAKFMKELSNSNLDIVHIHSPFSIGKIGLNYAQKNKIPAVATMHSQFKQDFMKATKSKTLTKMLLANVMNTFNGCYECWAVNSEVANVFVEYGAKQKPKVQNNGTDMKLLEDNSFIKTLKEKHNIKDDEKIFLFVGRIHALKNIFFILDVLKQLREENFKFKMLFVGTGQDEELFKEKIAKYNLENQVEMVGKITDRNIMAQYYKLADLFLFPSLYDASSLVQIEAASQKTPTLFIKGAVTAATVTEDQNGYISNNSVTDYKNKIVNIFNNPEQYNQVCENAYNELYVSWDQAVNKAYNDYLNIIKQYKNNMSQKDIKTKIKVRAKRIKNISLSTKKEKAKITKEKKQRIKTEKKTQLKQKIRMKNKKSV